MGFKTFITDNVDIYDLKGNCVYKNEGVILKSGNITIEGILKEIEKGYYIIRKINDNFSEKYNVLNVEYQNHPRNKFFRMIKLKVQKEGDELEEKNHFISAGTHIQAGGDIIIGDNNKNITNEVDKLVDLINKGTIDNKEEIKELLEEFKKTNDKSKLVDAFSILGSGASISSMIIALSNLIN
ncbi:MAG: hypothetical protein QM490_02705 [Candidatus Gracilibacteria bacterium]